MRNDAPKGYPLGAPLQSNQSSGIHQAELGRLLMGNRVNTLVLKCSLYRPVRPFWNREYMRFLAYIVVGQHEKHNRSDTELFITGNLILFPTYTASPKRGQEITNHNRADVAHTSSTYGKWPFAVC